MSRNRLSRGLPLLAVAMLLALACTDNPITSLEPSGIQLKPGRKPTLGGPTRMFIPDGNENALVSDGKASLPGQPAGTYEHEVCGVWSVFGYWNEFVFAPGKSRMTGKERRRCEQNDNLRNSSLRLADTTRIRFLSDPTTEWTIGSAALLGLVNFMQAESGSGAKINGDVLNIPLGSQLMEGRFSHRFCSETDNTGRPFRFGGDSGPLSDSILVTKTDPTHWLAQTQAYPNNKGWCQHYLSDGTEVQLLVHLDLAFEIEKITP